MNDYKPPYILVKQIYSLILLFLLIFLFTKLNLTDIANVLTFHLVLVVINTYAPITKEHFNYNKHIHYFVFFIAYLTPFLFLDINIGLRITFLSIAVSFSVGIFLLLISLKNLVRVITGNYQEFHKQLKALEFYELLVKFFLNIIGEELFFRIFIVESLRGKHYFVIIIISSVIFVHAHYINRWANAKYDSKAYFFHFIVGISLTSVYLVTNSLLACFISHFLFNTPLLISTCRRYLNAKKYENFSFNDY